MKKLLISFVFFFFFLREMEKKRKEGMRSWKKLENLLLLQEAPHNLHAWCHHFPLPNI